MNKTEKIECPRCGQFNPPQARYCMYCGERLVEEKRTVKKTSTEKKELNVKVLYILLFSLVFAGIAILYFAGVFDSETVVVKNKQTTQERVGKENSVAFSSPQVIDLKTLQELKNLEKELRNNPEKIDIAVTLGNKYFDYGHFTEAIDFYKTYLEKKPDSPDVLVDLGVCYYNLKDYKNAAEYMEKAIRINPAHQIACLNLGIVYEASGEIEKAKKYWQKAIEIAPNSQFGQRAKSFLNNY